MIFGAPNRKEALKRFKQWREKWIIEEERAVKCLEKGLHNRLRYYHFPEEIWKKIRTTNILERAFREVRRRTNPMGGGVSQRGQRQTHLLRGHRFHERELEGRSSRRDFSRIFDMTGAYFFWTATLANKRLRILWALPYYYDERLKEGTAGSRSYEDDLNEAEYKVATKVADLRGFYLAVCCRERGKLEPSWLGCRRRWSAHDDRGK